MNPQLIAGALCIALGVIWLLLLWLKRKPAVEAKTSDYAEIHRRVVELMAMAPNATMVQYLREAGKALYDAEGKP